MNTEREERLHSTITLFKEFRSDAMLTARNNAWDLKNMWDRGNESFKDNFIHSMINDKFSPAAENKSFNTNPNLQFESKHAKALYDLLAFYCMLSLDEFNGENIQDLNYYYYGWWRKFLYEIAKKYDAKRISDLNSD